jgi:threonine aldolase
MIDLRSDLETQPTDAMRRAMATAEVADDYFGEDPTVRTLEERAAKLSEKEAGLFVTSTTMANLLGVASQTRHGDVVIMETQAHIYRCEGAHTATISGTLPKQIDGVLGVLDAEKVEEAIISMGRSFGDPYPTLICHENTHGDAGGTCASVQDLRSVRDVALRHKLRVHIDGARIFNAAIALGVELRDLAAGADTMSISLTKGLGCPYGALLVGDVDTIKRAREVRQMIGGGIHQGGIMAAAGLVALDTMIERLSEDHANARHLAEGLADLGFEIDLRAVQTNIVFVCGFPHGLSRDSFVGFLADKKILAGRSGQARVRMVTHYGITRADIDHVLLAVRASLAPSMT